MKKDRGPLPIIPTVTEEYKYFAGPHGRVIAARLRKLKKWIVILTCISVVEFIAVAILVSIFAKTYIAFNKW
jgi:hypothetical protein